MVVVRTENLTKDYRVGFWRRRVRVLHGLNLEVQEGEIFGYLGPNGAGKTTTLKLLNGLILPTSGRAWVLGREVHEVGIKAQIGFLPENPSFYEYLTGREFLHFYGRLFGLGRGELRSRAAQLLELVGLASAADLQLRKYSRGMLQRIGLAQALVNDPRLLFLDEPMSGLDPIGRKEIRDLILRLKGEGRTVFFSSHIIPDVEMICDRVGIIVGGRLINVGRLEELLGSHLETIEVTAAGLNEELLARVAAYAERPVVRSGEQALIALRDEGSLEEVIRLLLEAKARILSIVPQKETLEEHFLKEVGREHEGPAHRPEHL